MAQSRRQAMAGLIAVVFGLLPWRRRAVAASVEEPVVLVDGWILRRSDVAALAKHVALGRPRDL